MHFTRPVSALFLILLCLFMIQVFVLLYRKHSLLCERFGSPGKASTYPREWSLPVAPNLPSKLEGEPAVPSDVFTASLQAQSHSVDSHSRALGHVGDYTRDARGIGSHITDDSQRGFRRRSTDSSPENSQYPETAEVPGKPEDTKPLPSPENAQQQDQLPAQRLGPPSLQAPASPFATVPQRTPLSPPLANLRLDSPTGRPPTSQTTFPTTPSSYGGDFGAEYSRLFIDRWRHRSPPALFPSWRHRSPRTPLAFDSPERLHQAVETHSDQSQRTSLYRVETGVGNSRVLALLRPVVRRIEQQMMIVYSHCPSTQRLRSPQTLSPDALDRRLQRLTCRGRWLVDHHQARGLNSREMREGAAVAVELEALERERIRRGAPQHGLAHALEMEERAARGRPQREQIEGVNRMIEEQEGRRQQGRPNEMLEALTNQRDGERRTIPLSELQSARPGVPRPPLSILQRDQWRTRPESPPLELMLQPWTQNGMRSETQYQRTPGDNAQPPPRRGWRLPGSQRRAQGRPQRPPSPPIEQHVWPWERNRQNRPSDPRPQPPTGPPRSGDQEPPGPSARPLRKRSPEGGEMPAEQHDEASTSRAANHGDEQAHAVEDGHHVNAPPDLQHQSIPTTHPPSPQQYTTSASQSALTQYPGRPALSLVEAGRPPERAGPVGPQQPQAPAYAPPNPPQEHPLHPPQRIDAPDPPPARFGPTHVHPIEAERQDFARLRHVRAQLRHVRAQLRHARAQLPRQPPPRAAMRAARALAAQRRERMGVGLAQAARLRRQLAALRRWEDRHVLTAFARRVRAIMEARLRELEVRHGAPRPGREEAP